MSQNWENERRALEADHRSPSSALASRAAALLVEVATQDPELLAEVARGVIRAQPALAAVIHVANVALRAVEALGLGSVGKALEMLQQGCEADRRAGAAALCALLDAPVTLVTTSAHASVVEALQELRRHDLLQGVICGEARPLLEGAALARWLVAQGVGVTLVPDAGLCAHLQPGAALVVGTEAILPQQVAHKLGTRAYATWASLVGVPRYILATRDRIYPPELAALFEVPVHPASELLREPPEGLQVDNRAFDLSPRELWSEIFVGGEPVAVAEQRGDHRLSRSLLPLSHAG